MANKKKRGRQPTKKPGLRIEQSTMFNDCSWSIWEYTPPACPRGEGFDAYGTDIKVAGDMLKEHADMFVEAVNEYLTRKKKEGKNGKVS